MFAYIKAVAYNSIPCLNKDQNMTKMTTTTATHRGIKIAVVVDSPGPGHGRTYSCTNNSGKTKAAPKWFATQGDAIANERYEIDAVLPLM